MIRTALAITLLSVSLVPLARPVAAQDAREAQLVGFRELCDQGNRKACVKFGMMLQQNADRHAEWRKIHPEFFFFEK